MATQEFGRIRELDRTVVVADAPTHAGSRTRWPGWGLRRLLCLGDAIAVAIAIAAALTIFGSERGAQSWLALATVPLWIPLFKVYGLYDRDGKRVSHSTLDDVPYVFHALVMGTLGLWLFYKVGVPGERLILRQSLACFGTGFASVLLMRGGVRGLAARLTPPERIVIVGDEDMSRLLMRKIRAHPEYGLDPIGYVAIGEGDTRERDGSQDADGARPRGRARLRQARRRARARRRPGRQPRRARRAHPPHADAEDPRQRRARLRRRARPVGRDRRHRGHHRARHQPAGADALLAGGQARDGHRDRGCPWRCCRCRCFAAVAIAVKLGSKGPIFYSQQRVGRDGSRFRLYKFRTMVPDADARAEELKAISEHPAWLLLRRTRASRASAASCATRASTSCRSCGTSSRAT